MQNTSADLSTAHALHIVRCYSYAARLNDGTTTLAARLAAIRTAVGK